MGTRPGVVIYFDDIMPTLDCLSLEDRGVLLTAILSYASGEGEAPDLSAFPVLNVVWSFLRKKIDRDSETYDQRVQRSRYGVYKRETMRRGEEPLPFEDWAGQGEPEAGSTHHGDISNQEPKQKPKQKPQLKQEAARPGAGLAPLFGGGRPAQPQGPRYRKLNPGTPILDENPLEKLQAQRIREWAAMGITLPDRSQDPPSPSPTPK